jgi:hypothetical protein
MRKQLGFAVIVLVLGILASCAHLVVVHDISGLPIESAEVVASCPAHDFAPEFTNARGEVRLNRRYTPNPRWLRVRKTGYEQVTVNPYPRSWPCVVTLRPIGT